MSYDLVLAYVLRLGRYHLQSSDTCFSECGPNLNAACSDSGQTLSHSSRLIARVLSHDARTQFQSVILNIT